MRNIDKLDVATGFRWLIFSAGHGRWLGASGHFTFAQSHAHIGLLGFVASVLFGVIQSAWPQLRERVLSTGKIIVDATSEPDLFLMLGAPIVILGALVFLWLFLASPATTPTPEMVPAE